MKIISQTKNTSIYQIKIIDYGSSNIYPDPVEQRKRIYGHY